MNKNLALVLGGIGVLLLGFFAGSFYRVEKNPTSKGLLGSIQTYPLHFTQNPTSLDQFFSWGGIENAGVTWLTGAVNASSTLTVAGASSLAGVTATSVSSINGTGTSTVAVGSSAIGVNPGKLCLWNGTQYSIISFAAGTTTVGVATSTSCQ